MKKLLLTIITLLTITNIANATTKENFICRDLGLSKIGNKMALVESEPYILKLDSKEDYYIEDKKIDTSYIGQRVCAKTWNVLTKNGITVNDYFYGFEQGIRDEFTEDFLKKLIKQ
jgi:hypothetical protein